MSMRARKIIVFFLITILLLTGVCELMAENDNANFAKNNNLFPEMKIYDAGNGKMISEKEFLAEIEKITLFIF